MMYRDCFFHNHFYCAHCVRMDGNSSELESVSISRDGGACTTDTATGTVQIVNYSGATPDVTRRHDLAGRLVSVEDGLGGRTFGYDAKGRLAAETNSLAVITRAYDSLGRDAGYDLDIPGYSTNRFSVRYGCDGSGRHALVTSACGGVTNAFCYSHVGGTHLVAGMTNGAGFGWSRSYEPGRNLITAVSNFWNASAVSSFGYGNDALGRRTLRIDAVPSVSATNTFAYNQRSEVTNAIMDAVTYAYSYDGIGNLQTSSAGVVASTYTASTWTRTLAMANMRAKNRKPTTISFTAEEMARMEPFIKSLKFENRSDFVRMIVKEWMDQRKRIKERDAEK